MATDQEIRDAGILYLPSQKYLANPFVLPEDEENDNINNEGILSVRNITARNPEPNNPFSELLPTFTRENPVSTPAMSDISSQNLSAYLTNPSLQAKYGNFAEYDEFMQSQMPQPNFIQRGITGIKDTFGRFFQPKVRGTLGDRLTKQYEFTSKLPTPLAALANMRSPFNPTSPTYNAALPSQLNFLEGTLGSRITGTSDNLKVTDGLAMIGRDPNTGGLKYGPGSVLFGKNVISGFGTNDYEQALNDYISKMTARGKLSEFQKAKLRQANTELANLQAKQEEEYRTGGTRDEVIDLQERIDKGDFDSTSDKPDRDPGSVTTESAAKSKGVGGGGYTKSDSARESRRGGQYGFKKGGLAGILGY